MAVMGRKPKYGVAVKPHLDKIAEWIGAGATENEVCKKLGISRSAFAEYKNKFAELMDAVKKGRDISDDAVEAALFRSATGYDVEETTGEERRNGDGDRDCGTVRVVKHHIAPNVTAAIFWLKNRRPGQWKDRKQVDLGIGDLELTPEEEKL